MQNFGLIRQWAGIATLESMPMPALQNDYILVETQTVALNPTDWTTLDATGDAGTLVGCDYSGIVVHVGEHVNRHFSKGDSVAGLGHGGNDAKSETGAFARFVAVKGDLQMHIPDGVSFVAACSVGVGVGSAGYGLYKVLGLPWPGVEGSTASGTILIYGGSTATGTVAIQFAKLSGWTVVTTCFPRHFDLVKRLGADAAFDYRTSDVGLKIREATSSRIKKVLDTVNVDSSAAICADAFGPDGGTYCNLLGLDCPRSDVESIFFLEYDMSGELYKFEGTTYEARPEALAFGRESYKTAERLWAEGKWEPHPQRVGSGVLLGVLDGMQEMREGLVSGQNWSIGSMDRT